MVSRGAVLGALVLTALSPAPVSAATRSYIVTDFDTLRLEGPIELTVATGRGVSARGEGDADLLERVDLSVTARTLTIRLKPALFEARREKATGPVRLALTVPALRRLQLSGTGSVRATGLDKRSAEVLVSGSGSVSVSGIDADSLSVMQTGSGSVQLAGQARSLLLRATGSGAIDAKALAARDLDLTLEGAGSVETMAERSAKVVAVGPGTITVSGKAACTVRHAGNGAVRCGGESF
jgi:hypothetical protein